MRAVTRTQCRGYQDVRDEEVDASQRCQHDKHTNVPLPGSRSDVEGRMRLSHCKCAHSCTIWLQALCPLMPKDRELVRAREACSDVRCAVDSRSRRRTMNRRMQLPSHSTSAIASIKGSSIGGRWVIQITCAQPALIFQVKKGS